MHLGSIRGSSLLMVSSSLTPLPSLERSKIQFTSLGAPGLLTHSCSLWHAGPALWFPGLSSLTQILSLRAFLHPSLFPFDAQFCHRLFNLQGIATSETAFSSLYLLPCLKYLGFSQFLFTVYYVGQPVRVALCWSQQFLLAQGAHRAGWDACIGSP